MSISGTVGTFGLYTGVSHRKIQFLTDNVTKITVSVIIADLSVSILGTVGPFGLNTDVSHRKIQSTVFPIC